MRASPRNVIEDTQILVVQSRFRIEKAKADKRQDAELVAGLQRQLAISRKVLAVSPGPLGRPP